MRNLSPIPLVLLLAVLRAVASRPRPPGALPFLPRLSARPVRLNDVLGEWRLAFAQNETLCPTTIEHTGYNRRHRNAPIRISHNKIIQDAVRCFNRKTVRDRRFRFFSSAAVLPTLQNTTVDPRVPRKLLKLLRKSPATRRAKRAANQLKEHYFIGFEARNRVCDGKRLFKRGTTAFLLRPSKRSVVIKNVDLHLTPGTRWLVMIPLFKRVSCVYSAPLRNAAANPTADDDEQSPSPDGSENELGASTDGGACFPADATVTLQDGRSVPIATLSVGDNVQVAPDHYSDVFMFTHKLHSVRAQFRRVHLDSGNTLLVTDRHYVYANGNLVTASALQVGDRMPLADGSSANVLHVTSVSAIGLFNPQTMHGDIVVNGVRVSTYTQAVNPTVAHTLLSPLRAIFRLLGMDATFGLFNNGLSRTIPPTPWRVLSP